MALSLCSVSYLNTRVIRDMDTQTWTDCSCCLTFSGFGFSFSCIPLYWNHNALDSEWGHVLFNCRAITDWWGPLTVNINQNDQKYWSSEASAVNTPSLMQHIELLWEPICPMISFWGGAEFFKLYLCMQNMLLQCKGKLLLPYGFCDVLRHFFKFALSQHTEKMNVC